MKKRTFLSVLILLMVSLSYSLFSQQNTVQQNTVWEVVNFDETTVDRYPNIPFSICNNLIMDKVTKEGFLCTDYGLMKTQDGGFNWKPCMFNQHEWKASVSSVQGDKALVVVDNFIPDSSVYCLVSNFNTDEATMQYIYHYKPGYKRDFPVERGPKSAFYKGEFYFVALDDEWKLYSLDLNGTKTEVNVIERNQDIGLWASTGIIDIFVKNNILYVITDKGQIYVQDSVLNLQKQIMRFTYGMLEISPESISYLFTDENICYLIQNKNPNYEGYYPPVSDIEVKLVDDRLKIRTINVFTNDKIKDMIFVDNNQGYIITEFSDDSYFRNYIYSTKNGGLSWKKEYETEEHLNNLYSIDGVVYAIKERGLLMRDNSNEGQIRVVVDGNYDNWVPAYIPARTPDTLRSVWCVNDTTCFVVGNKNFELIKTADGFKNDIQRININDISGGEVRYYSRVAFKNDTLGYLFSSGVSPFKTIDRGNNWLCDMNVMDGPPDYAVTGVEFCKDGIVVSQTHGRVNYWFSAVSLGGIINREPVPVLGIDLLVDNNDSLIFCLFADGQAFRKTLSGQDAGTPIFDRSLPGGLPLTEMLIRRLTSEYGTMPTHNYYSVHFIGNKGFIVTNFGLLFRSTDYGLLWNAIQEFGTPLYYIASDSVNNIYAVGDHIILNSRDGGETWHKQKIIDRDGTITDNFPYKLRSVFVADNYVYAVGVGDVILRGRILPSATGTPTPQPEEKVASMINNQATSLFYPNPADKYIEFTSIPNNAIVKIMDVLGREVFHGKVIGNILTVENYENGIYSVVISDGNKVKTGKFMVQH